MVTTIASRLAELYQEQTDTFRLRLTNGNVQESSVMLSRGIGLRTVTPDQITYVHTQDQTSLLAKASSASLRQLLHQLPAGPAAGPDEGLAANLLSQMARESSQAATLASPKIWRVDVSVRQVIQEVCLANTEGISVVDRRHVAGLQVEVFVREQKRLRSALRTYCAAWPERLFAGGMHLALAREAAEEALRRLEAVSAPAGEMTVVLGPGNPATLFHEACGHGVEADLAAQPDAVYGGRLHQLIASEQITLIDDPTLPDLPGSYARDDEGTPARPTTLIERGRLTAYLHDRDTAARYRLAPNGHARRMSAAFPPMPRMSNTYLAPGEYQPDEIIAETERGILITRIGAGDTNMVTGEFNLECTEGYLIEHGRVTAPIRGAIISGKGSEVLRNIDRVGCDFQMCHSMETGCAKVDQGPLRIAYGQPTVRVPRLMVWGG